MRFAEESTSISACKVNCKEKFQIQRLEMIQNDPLSTFCFEQQQKLKNGNNFTTPEFKENYQSESISNCSFFFSEIEPFGCKIPDNLNNQEEQDLQEFNLFNKQKIIPKQDEKDYQRIFDVKGPKKLSEKLPKNTNVAKHFMKQFINKCLNKKYLHHFSEQPELLRQVTNFIKRQKKMYKDNKNWNNNLQAMGKIFGHYKESTDPKGRSLIMRKIAHQMIRNEMILQVLANKQIKDNSSKSYIYNLLALIYRCKNPELMQRTQVV